LAAFRTANHIFKIMDKESKISIQVNPLIYYLAVMALLIHVFGGAVCDSVEERGVKNVNSGSQIRTP
jgi:hypothetical protein